MEYLDTIITTLTIHWPFLSVAGAIFTVTHFFKQVAPPADTNKFWSVVWRLLPLHAVILGFLVGALPWVPLPEIVHLGPLSRIFYYTGAGVLATWAWDLIKTYGKYKLKVVEEPSSDGV